MASGDHRHAVRPSPQRGLRGRLRPSGNGLTLTVQVPGGEGRPAMLKRTNLSVLAAVAAACAIGASGAQAAWTVTSGTPPANTAQLAGVACTSTTFCLMAGPQSGTTTRAYVLRY